MFFARGEKTVECERIFANVTVNQKSNFRVEFAERGISGKRDGNEVTNTADIHKNLVRSFVGKTSAKLSNHRSPVLPLFFRPSTQIRDSGYSPQKGTTPLAQVGCEPDAVTETEVGLRPD